MVWWTFENLDCTMVRQMLEAQIAKWNFTDICEEDPDARCWYPPIAESIEKPGKNWLIKTTHITEIPGRLQIEDRMWLSFRSFNRRKSCKVRALSQSPMGHLRDSGTNYCNMYNLVVGAGLNHPAVGFREMATRFYCSSLEGYDFRYLQEIMCPERNCCLEKFTGAGTLLQQEKEDPTASKVEH